MSKYTTELRFICEQLTSQTESQDNTHTDAIITAAAPLIFTFSFPIFDNSYKQGLEEKIIRHYYTREIGFETYGLFKLKLQTKLNEIMPYYNQLYESALLTLDPLNNYKLHKTSAGQNAENTTNSGSLNSTENTTDGRTVGIMTTGQTASTTEGEAWTKFSDTPQGAVTGLDNDTYLTNATKNTDERSDAVSTNGTSNTTESGTGSRQRADTTSGTGSRTGTNSYVEDVIGFSGVNQSELLQKFRETFLNIDMMVINELEELFLQLW